MTTRRRVSWLAITFALVLTVLVVVGPFLVPVRPLGAATPLKKLAGPNSRFIDVPLAGDKLTVHYEEAGEGKPAFLLLHGFAASTFSWRGQGNHPNLEHNHEL